MLPASITVPILIGWLRSRGEAAGLLSDWVGLAIMIVSASALLGGITTWTGFVIDRTDADRRGAEESAQRLVSIVSSSNDAIFGEDLEGTVASWNAGAEAIYGYSAEEIIGRSIAIAVPPEGLDEFRLVMQRVARGEQVRHYETLRLRKDGEIFHVSLSISPVRDEGGTVVGVSTVARDISERKRSEEKMQRMNRTLLALSECTDALMRATDESAMLQKVCDVVVNVAGCRMAWVGYAEADESKTVRPMAAAGFEQGYLKTANISWRDVERGRGPTGTSIRTGRTTAAQDFAQDFAQDRSLEPWREDALRLGYRSSIAVPLKTGTNVIGALTIYAAEPGWFESDVQRLLEELASNMTYAIMTVRARAERERVEEELRQTSSYARSLIEASLDPLVTISKDGKIMDVNRATEQATGVARKKLIDSDFADYFTEPEKARSSYQRVYSDGVVQDYPLAIRHVSGKVTDVLYNASVFKNEVGEVQGVFAAARDVTERKRAEEAVAAERQKFNTILDVLTPYVVLLTADYHVAFSNQEFRERFGEAKGRRCFEFLFERTEPCEICETYKVLKVGKALDWEWTGPDGRHYEVHDFPFTDTDGSKLILEMGVDVTERKKAEAARQESETDFGMLANFVPQLVWICTPDGLNIYFNQRWVEYTGLTLEESYGTGWNKPFHPNDKQAAWDAWNHATKTGDPYRVESRLRAADGSYRWFLMRGLPLRDANGTIVKWFGTCTDIDDMKRAEERVRQLNRELEERVEQRTAQLVESEKRVRRKLESILLPEGDLGQLELADVLDIPAVKSLVEDFYAVTRIPTALIDVHGNFLVAVGLQEVCTKFHRRHPETCRNCVESDMYLSAGVEPGEFKVYRCKNNLWDVSTPIMVGGQHLGNLFTGQFLFAEEAFDEECFRLQARKYGFDEDEYLAAFHKVPRLAREFVNESMAFLAKLAQVLSHTGHSTVKLARSLEELRRVNSELADSIKELESFTYSVSHDLRAPLRHISGFSRILTEEFGASLPPEAQHHLQRIAEGTLRMGTLVDDLLNLARVGRRDLSLQVAGLQSVVDEVISGLKADLADRQVEWKISSLPYVECDPGLMKQVFQNLLSNAVKFTRPRAPAVIEVGQEEQDSKTVIYVRDNGVGFSMKYADKLFGVFQRLHRPEDFEGTGVGLATVQRIIQKHGGRIWAAAELDKGATFYFTLGTAEKIEAQTMVAKIGEKA